MGTRSVESPQRRRSRAPYLLLLPFLLVFSLFFLYPLFVSQLLNRQNPRQEPVMWALFGFSSAAGLVFLTLLPALHRGPDYVKDNGRGIAGVAPGARLVVARVLTDDGGSIVDVEAGIRWVVQHGADGCLLPSGVRPYALNRRSPRSIRASRR